MRGRVEKDYGNSRSYSQRFLKSSVVLLESFVIYTRLARRTQALVLNVCARVPRSQRSEAELRITSRIELLRQRTLMPKFADKVRALGRNRRNAEAEMARHHFLRSSSCRTA